MRLRSECQPERQTSVGNAKIDDASQFRPQHHGQFFPAAGGDSQGPVGMPAYFSEIHQFRDRLFSDLIALTVDQQNLLGGAFDKFLRSRDVSQAADWATAALTSIR